MLTIYYKKGCTSSNKAMKWLDSHEVGYYSCRIKEIQKEDLLYILSLTENGMNDIVKLQGDERIQQKIRKLYQMTLNKAIDYLIEYPEIIKIPIIITKNKLLIGYNDAEIRKFIPRSMRKIDKYQIIG